MTRFHANNIRARYLIHVIHIESPHPCSLASLVMLNKKYYGLDKSIFSKCRMFNIRRKWMNKLVADNPNGLTCAICGKSGLSPHANNKDPHHRNLATLDHIIAIKDGGSWKDMSNFQVACYPCNMAKDIQTPC